MPPKAKAKARKPKKPALQKQKQKQSQRVVVNINQEKAKARRRAKARQPQQPQQQVSYQPLILSSGSVPQSMPSFNPTPSPIQSTTGFNIPPPMPSLGTPINMSSPVELPVFAEEPVRVIGDENLSAPVSAPVSVPTPIRVPPPSIISEITPDLRAPPPTISSSKPPSVGKDKQFIAPPPPPPQSISSLLSDISKETGITSQSVADFLFKKKKTESKQPEPKQPELKRPEPRPPVRIEVPKSDISTSEAESMSTISTKPSFNPPSEKSSIKPKPIIAEPKEVVVLKKPELKRSSPYDPFGIFSDNESIARGGGEPEEEIFSDKAEKGSITMPAKKRPVVISSESEREFNKFNVPEETGRRMPATEPVRLAPVKEKKKSNYQSKEQLQVIAKKSGIDLNRPNGKPKTREELRLEIAGK